MHDLQVLRLLGELGARFSLKGDAVVINVDDPKGGDPYYVALGGIKDHESNLLANYVGPACVSIIREMG